jgi:hypothetical protein
MQRRLIKDRVIKDLCGVIASAAIGAALGAGIGASLPDVGEAYVPPHVAATLRAAQLRHADQRIHEEDPRWNCATMGNKICGHDPVVIAGLGSVVGFEVSR